MTEHVFRPGNGRGRAVVGLFISGIVTSLLAIGVFALQIDILLRMGAGGTWTEAEAETIDQWIMLVVGIDALVLLVGAVAFLVWLYRVRSNLPALGATDLRWSPGWAIGWWFVPFANLYFPFKVVKEVWQASGADDDPVARPDAETPEVLLWWWGLYLGSSIGGRAADQIYEASSETIDGLIIGTLVVIVGHALLVVATIPAIKVVKGINRRQAERHKVIAF